jgi:hypothetical protein
MQTGLDGFKALLKEFRGLSIWAVGGAMAVPFAASLADLSPPWPSGIVPVTAVIELLTLVLVYQFFKSSKRIVINRIILISLALFAIAGSGYLITVSLYTFQIPKTSERYVKGYECTPDAKLVFRDRCPDLGLDELRTAAYEADRLWTRKSITVMRTSIVSIWSLTFIGLSFGLGAFLVYQMKIRKPAKKSPKKVE